MLPILFCFGREGSGKSTATRLAGFLHEAPIFNGNTSTFSSMRNYLQLAKYLDEEGKYEADGPALLYDNCSIGTFLNDKDKFNLMLGGYNKATDSCSIAMPGTGQNMVFRTAATRIISSVEPIHSVSELKELARRMTFCFHESLDKISDESRALYKSHGAHDIDAVNWEGFSEVYHAFWGSMDNCLLYVAALKKLRKPKGFETKHWEYCKYLIATGIAIAAWPDPQSAYSYYEKYYELVKDRVKSAEGTIEIFLRELLEKIEYPKTFENSFLKSTIEVKMNAGYFLEKPRSKEIHSGLMQLNYKLIQGQWVRQD